MKYHPKGQIFLHLTSSSHSKYNPPMNPAERAILTVEEQIQAGVRAREIFESVKNLQKPEGYEYEVSVVSFAKERATPDDSRTGPNRGRSFTLRRGLSFTTESSTSPAHAMRRIAESFVNESGEAESLREFEYIVNTVNTGGVEPRVGDVAVERRRHGFFGSLRAIRIIKPEMGPDAISSALGHVSKVSQEELVSDRIVDLRNLIKAIRIDPEM